MITAMTRGNTGRAAVSCKTTHSGVECSARAWGKSFAMCLCGGYYIGSSPPRPSILQAGAYTLPRPTQSPAAHHQPTMVNYNRVYESTLSHYQQPLAYHNYGIYVCYRYMRTYIPVDESIMVGVHLIEQLVTRSISAAAAAAGYPTVNGCAE